MYDQATQATDDNIIRRMRDNYGYRHTLRTYNSYCFSTASCGYSKVPQYYVCTYIACLVLICTNLCTCIYEHNIT